MKLPICSMIYETKYNTKELTLDDQKTFYKPNLLWLSSSILMPMSQTQSKLQLDHLYWNIQVGTSPN